MGGRPLGEGIDTQMKIGFIGFGEAAYCISCGLREEGVTGIVAYDAFASRELEGRRIHDRASESGVGLLDNPADVASYADTLFVAVPSTNALEVCEAIRASLKAGQIYADVSASSPETKRRIWELIRDTGVLFVDAAMLGSLPQDRHRVPITASGNGAEAFHEAMTPLGMRITVVGGGSGAASAIKLVRSIFMKGLASLMIEMLQAADAQGVTDDVVASLSGSLDGVPFRNHLSRLVTGTALHAKRRADELKGSIALLGEARLDDAMTIAAKHKHELVAEYRFSEAYASGKPSGYGEIIERLKVKR